MMQLEMQQQIALVPRVAIEKAVTVAGPLRNATARDTKRAILATASLKEHGEKGMRNIPD